MRTLYWTFILASIKLRVLLLLLLLVSLLQILEWRLLLRDVTLSRFSYPGEGEEECAMKMEQGGSQCRYLDGADANHWLSGLAASPYVGLPERARLCCHLSKCSPPQKAIERRCQGPRAGT